MDEGYKVVADQLREHAAHVDAVKNRFGAVKSASAHIAQNDSAYGWLCRWMPGRLEERHKAQDELYTFVEENLRLVAERLRQDAEKYENAERFAADSVNSLATEAGWAQ